MRRRARRGNRLGLTLTGLLLTAAGAAVLTRARGLYGGGASTPLYPPAAQHYLHSHTWIWPAAAAVAIITGLAFLRWLLVQPRRDLLRRLRLDSDRHSQPGAGRTVLLGSAVTSLIGSDLTAQPGVRTAITGLTGHPDQPELWLAITTDPAADLTRLCGHLTGQLLPSLRASLEQPALPACLRITVSRRTPRTTRPAAPTLHGADASQPPGTRPDPPRARTRPPAEADLPVRAAAPPRGCGAGAAPAHTLATRAADRQPPQAAGKQGPAPEENPQ